MTRISNGDVLTDVEVEIAAPGGNHKCALDGRRPDDFVIDEPLDVLEDRVALVAGLRQRGVCIGTEQDRVRTVDAGKTQLLSAWAIASGYSRMSAGQRQRGLLVPCLTPTISASGSPRRSRRLLHRQFVARRLWPVASRRPLRRARRRRWPGDRVRTERAVRPAL